MPSKNSAVLPVHPPNNTCFSAKSADLSLASKTDATASATDAAGATTDATALKTNVATSMTDATASKTYVPALKIDAAGTEAVLGVQSFRHIASERNSRSGRHGVHGFVLGACAAFSICSIGFAQCNDQWNVVVASPSQLLGSINAMCLWDRDGSGPAPLTLMLGGNFQAFAGGPRFAVVGVDLQTSAWSVLGRAGTFESVHALTVMSDNTLVAAGSFSSMDGVPANNIAKFDGQNWSAFGSGVSGNFSPAIETLLALPGGRLIVGGSLVTAGGIPASGIAEWNGGSWTSLGAGLGGLFSSRAMALARLPSGTIVVGGNFWTAGNQTANYIATWDGTSWGRFLGFVNGVPVYNGANSAISAIAMTQAGDLVVGGGFTSVVGIAANRIAVGNTLGWTNVGGGVNGGVNAVAVAPNNDIIAAGAFTQAGSIPVNYITRFDGLTWTSLGTGLPRPAQDVLVMPNGDIVASGLILPSPVVGSDVFYLWRWGRPNGCTLGCDPIDFNANGVFPEDQDVVDYLDVLAGGSCPACNDIDFNNNGVFPEDQDVADFFNVLAGGTCP